MAAGGRAGPIPQTTGPIGEMLANQWDTIKARVPEPGPMQDPRRLRRCGFTVDPRLASCSVRLR